MSQTMKQSHLVDGIIILTWTIFYGPMFLWYSELNGCCMRCANVSVYYFVVFIVVGSIAFVDCLLNTFVIYLDMAMIMLLNVWIRPLYGFHSACVFCLWLHYLFRLFHQVVNYFRIHLWKFGIIFVSVACSVSEFDLILKCILPSFALDVVLLRFGMLQSWRRFWHS